MNKFQGLIVGNNNMDIHTSDQFFIEIATVFDPRYAILFSAAPDLLDCLVELLEQIDESNLDVVVNIDKARAAIEKALNYKK